MISLYETPGEKVKAYLIAGTRKLSFQREYPNTDTGYGALCLNDTFRWIGITTF
ncbi:hypothetical protein [Anaeromicropila populeti]|uniref:Uncharacterized protein n=1 Tax=Anaeromicropila populeti TaxID=37658 RepID=A0A1I6JB93_9FIRM|nr:hypothetical protein [Anaeromicropila populeti]SFR76218.1 hypothetical protein SAMN05661086_01524 [Anaeromicropila populeti]